MDAETLIKKLSRSGKLAELWPENKPSGKKKSGKSKKQKDNNTPPDQEGADDGEEADKNDSGGDDVDGKDADDDGGENDEAGGDGGGGGGNNGGGGKKKKKKKKKGQNGNSGNAAGAGENPGDSAPAGVPVDPAPVKMGPVNLGPPIQHVYHYPPTYYNQQAPVMYGLSYSTSYPSPSASFFASNMHGNFYSHPEMYALPSDSIHRRSDGDDDNDESGCSIM